ncbi:hypothetical protein ACFL5O_07030 [Myxococcota bacterium]
MTQEPGDGPTRRWDKFQVYRLAQCVLKEAVLMRPLHRLPTVLGSFALLGGCLMSGLAQGASASITVTDPPDRKYSVDSKREGDDRYAVSLADCLKGDAFEFTVVSSFSSGNDLLLEVFATHKGSTYRCDNEANRTTAGSDCERIYSSTAETGSVAITIPVRNIVTQSGGTKTATDCTLESSSTQKVAATLYFVLSDPSTSETVGSTSWATSVDLAGPVGPTGVSADSGEGALNLRWKMVNSSDVRGYKMYCAAVGGTETAVSSAAEDTASSTQALEAAGAAGTAASGSGRTGSTGAAAGLQGASAATGTAGSAGAAGVGDRADSSAGMGGGGGNGDAAGSHGQAGNSSGPLSNARCSVSPAVPDELPSKGWQQCGEAAGQIQEKTRISGLANGTEYAVTVVSYDAVGNRGKPASLDCETPREVNDFFELYRRAGGDGGGGFCATSAGSDPCPLWYLAGAWMALRLRRRRQKD